MCRSHFKANMYHHFFNDLREVYCLTGPPNLTYSTPLFDSWDGFTAESEDSVFPVLTDPETTEPESMQSEAEDSSGALACPTPCDDSSINILDSTTQRYPPPRRQLTNKMSLIVNLVGDSSASDSDNEAETTLCQAAASTPITSRPVSSRPSHKPHKSRQVSKTGGSDHVCCPKGFQQTVIEGKKTPKRIDNPYTKTNFLWDQWSSDEDFSEAKPKRKGKSTSTSTTRRK